VQDVNQAGGLDQTLRIKGHDGIGARVVDVLGVRADGELDCRVRRFQGARSPGAAIAVGLALGLEELADLSGRDADAFSGDGEAMRGEPSTHVVIGYGDPRPLEDAQGSQLHLRQLIRAEEGWSLEGQRMVYHGVGQATGCLSFDAVQ